MFPNDAYDCTDIDGDGIGNEADTDDDGDGVLDAEDFEALNPDVWEEPRFNLSFPQYMSILLALVFLAGLLNRDDDDEA